MSEKRYVYRLDVTYPEGSERWDWEPEGWEADWIGPDETRSFRWPIVKPYLSRSGAVTRARLLISYGASVRIFRSAPVEWPDEPDEVSFAPVAGPSMYHSFNPRDVALLGGDPSF